MNKERIFIVRDWAYQNLTKCIIPFWTSEYILDEENGGFAVRITGDMQKDTSGERSLLFYGRLTYAFSKSYCITKNPVCLERAKRAFYYIYDYFYDKEYGLAYSSVNAAGKPVDTNKSLYCESFFVIACGAYFEASGDLLAKELGLAAFELIEKKYKQGPAVYSSGFIRDYSAPASMLGGKALTLPEGTVRFQLHLCHAYEFLYQATKDKRVGAALKEFVEYIPTVLYDTEYHCFKNTLDQHGKRIGMRQLIGHDAEICCMTTDIAEMVGDKAQIARANAVVIDACKTILDRDIDEYGALIEMLDLTTGKSEKERVWWLEAVAAISLICGYQITRENRFWIALEKLISYIDNYFIDRDHGDWYNVLWVNEDGAHYVDSAYGFDKVNSIKDPFHTVMMCTDLIKRCELMAK